MSANARRPTFGFALLLRLLQKVPFLFLNFVLSSRANSASISATVVKPQDFVHQHFQHLVKTLTGRLKRLLMVFKKKYLFPNWDIFTFVENYE